MMSTASQAERVAKQKLILKYIEVQLQRTRRDMQTSIEENLRQAGELQEGWDERDSPAEDEVRDIEFCHRDALLTQLRKIDEALDRIKHKRFGVCTACGKRIATRRLFNDLTVARCIDCQSKAEGAWRSPTM